MKYCRRIKVGGHFCNAGSIKLWKKLINSSQLKVLDDLLIELGGELLSGKWHWSSSEYSNCNAWVFCMDSSNGASWGSVDYFNKDNNYSYFIVRPVLDLSDLS